MRRRRQRVRHPPHGAPLPRGIGGFLGLFHRAFGPAPGGLAGHLAEDVVDLVAQALGRAVAVAAVGVAAFGDVGG